MPKLQIQSGKITFKFYSFSIIHSIAIKLARNLLPSHGKVALKMIVVLDVSKYGAL